MKLLVLIPAYNEEANIAFVVDEARAVLQPHYGAVPILVVDDCSTDSTAGLARSAGAEVLSLPYHLGLGGGVQAGYRWAYEMGFDTVVRIDGDGQHDPNFIPKLISALESSPVQMVIGSRFADREQRHAHTSLARQWGIQLFRAILRPMLGQEVRDPTSGFVAVNRQALALFSRSFPLEYPEIEALVVLQRRAFHFLEVPVTMRPRRGGVSTITAPKALYYLLHVLLGVVVNILRFERHRWR